jgi:hypothetical protein
LLQVRRKVKGEGGVPFRDKGQGEREERFLYPLTFSFFPLAKGLLQETAMSVPLTLQDERRLSKQVY